MFKKLIKIQIIMTIILVSLYGAAYFSIVADKKSAEEVISQQTAPEGKKYLDYCEGGTSDYLSDTNDDSCLAERPGDFAKFALAMYVVIILLSTPLISFAVLVAIKRLRLAVAK
ncbi:hypothetical protein KBF61_03110 [Candidatus Saccharibacteria bacterium]|jgi:hypothetical protein|nr:hypothetical protein [Candidatus Saccharibacteria bacterium]